MDENKVDFEKMTPAERLKYEVAEEVGLADKVRQYGWRSLTAKESGGLRSDDEEKAGNEAG